MTGAVVCIPADTTLDECMGLMTVRHIRHLPVTENERPVGMVSIGDIGRAMIENQGFVIASARALHHGRAVASARVQAARGQVSDKHDDTGDDRHRSEKDWRSSLTAEQYRVLRQHAPNRRGRTPTTPSIARAATCAPGAARRCSPRSAKFDSGSGWPSYFEAFDAAVETTVDHSYGMVRVEMHCRRCGGHLGHIFDDGPAPTGKRYCTNGMSLKFEPVAETEPADEPRLTTDG